MCPGQTIEFDLLLTVTLSPVVSSSGLSKHEVVGSEEISEGTSPDRVHRSWLQVDEDSTGDVLATCRW